MINIGVLALQGDFLEHYNVLKKIIGINPSYVKKSEDLKNLHGLIIPGGESTTIGKLLKIYKLDIAIKKAVKNGMAIYGTCAGCVLLAKKVDSPYSLKLIDIKVKRNAYGRQIDSFESPIGLFIRAPKIQKVLNKNVNVLKRYGKEIVLVQQNKILVGTFHPELTNHRDIYQYFINSIRNINYQ